MRWAFVSHQSVRFKTVRFRRQSYQLDREEPQNQSPRARVANAPARGTLLSRWAAIAERANRRPTLRRFLDTVSRSSKGDESQSSADFPRVSFCPERARVHNCPLYTVRQRHASAPKFLPEQGVAMSCSINSNTHITLRQARPLWEAKEFANRVGLPLNYALTMHIEAFTDSVDAYDPTDPLRAFRKFQRILSKCAIAPKAWVSAGSNLD